MRVDSEPCANCGHKIGPLEQAYLWDDAVVCAGCYIRLNETRPIDPSSGKPRPPHVVFREKLKSPRFRLMGAVLTVCLLVAAWRIIAGTGGPHYLTPRETTERLAEAGLHPRLESSAEIFRGRELFAHHFTRDVNLPRGYDLTAYFDGDGRLMGIAALWMQHKREWPIIDDSWDYKLERLERVVADPSGDEARYLRQRESALEAIERLTGYEFSLARMTSQKAYMRKGPWAVSWDLADSSEYSEFRSALITLERRE